MPNPVFATKPLEWFKPDSQQARKDFGSKEDGIALGESMRVRQLQALVAGSKGNVWCGHRRLWAAHLVGLKELDVIISDEPLTESQIRVLQLQENLHRKALTGYETFAAYYELLQLNPSWDQRQLAEHLKVDPASVSRALSVSRCVPGVRVALQQGRITLSDANNISKAEEAEQQKLLERRLSGEIATRDEIAARVRKPRNRNPATQTRIRCELPGACVTITGAGLDFKGVVKALSTATKEARKAEAEKLDLVAWQDVMHHRAAAEQKKLPVDEAPVEA